MRRIATALLALAASMASVAHAAPPPMQTVESVDLKRYAGMWYEIANFPMVFQRDCVGDTTAEYTLHPDGSVGREQPLPQQGRRGRFRVRHGHRGRRQQQRQAGSHVPAPSRATTGSSAWTRNTAGPWSARPTASICGSCRARPSCRRKTWTARWPPRRAISWMSCGIRRRSSVHVPQPSFSESASSRKPGAQPPRSSCPQTPRARPLGMMHNSAQPGEILRGVIEALGLAGDAGQLRLVAGATARAAAGTVIGGHGLIFRRRAQRFGTGAHRSPIISRVARVRSLSGSSSSLTRSK